MSSVRRVHRKRDGLLLIEPNGSARFLTWWESLRYRITGALPAITAALGRGSEGGSRG